MSVRVVMQSHYKSTPQIDGKTIEIWKVRLDDMDRRGFLMLKTYRQKVKQFNDCVVPGSTYLFDRIKLTLNSKGEIILQSTSNTVFREESDESDVSLELSQKQRDFLEENKGNYGRAPIKIAPIDQALQNAAKADANKQLPYITQGSSKELNAPPLLGSTKQIWQEAQKMLSEWIKAD